MIRNAKDIAALGTIMGLWAHPDDETWSSAGIMATAAAQGQHIAVLSATNGDAGQTADEAQWAAASLRDIRQSELRHALAAVEVTDVIFLDYEDDKLGEVDEGEVLHIIERHVKAVNPDTILTFEPSGITGHTDHKKISQWAQEIAKKSDKDIAVYGAVTTRETYELVGKKADEAFNVFFAIDEPNLYEQGDLAISYQLPEDVQTKKRAAFNAHASQTHALMNHPIGRQLIDRAVQKESFIRLI